MKKYSISIRLTSVFLTMWLVISSCGLLDRTTRIGETRTETQTVELGTATEVRVQIKMGAGELSVADGADSLMDATFRYNVADWRPRFNYEVNSSRGELVVDHQGEAIPFGGSLINEWDLLLSSAVPLDLEIETGAGESELDLHGLNLTGLRIENGAGTTNVDLSVALDHDLDVIITGGVGELSVKLPGDMGVRVSADTGIGSLTSTGLTRDGDYYVNDAYNSSPHTLYLNIDAGIGSINLRTP